MCLFHALLQQAAPPGAIVWRLPCCPGFGIVKPVHCCGTVHQPKPRLDAFSFIHFLQTCKDPEAAAVLRKALAAHMPRIEAELIERIQQRQAMAAR